MAAPQSVGSCPEHVACCYESCYTCLSLKQNLPNVRVESRNTATTVACVAVLVSQSDSADDEGQILLDCANDGKQSGQDFCTAKPS